jgi:DNA primase
MEELYRMTLTNTTANTERPAHGLGKAIQAVKDAVSVEDYARNLTELRPAGPSLRGWCPVHVGSNPDSFAVYPDKRRWYCYRCNRGGDVVDLCQLVEGGELWEAMYTLARRYNVELPQRPPQWAPWQDEKAKRRRMIRHALADSYQRRLFRVFGGHLSEISDPDEYEREAARYFDGLRPLAVNCAEHRMHGGAHE